MNPRDGHVHLGQYHEQLGVWVEGHLEEEGLAWGPLSSAELSTIALKVMCSTPRRFAECFFENRPEHGGGPWRFLEPLQTDSIDYPYNTANESAYGTGKTRELTAYNLHTVGCTEGSVLFVAHSMTARQQVWDEIEFQLSKSAFLARIFPREFVTRGNNPELRGRVGNSAKLKLTTRGGRQIHSLHIGMALGVLTVPQEPSCRALGRSVEPWSLLWSPGPSSRALGRSRWSLGVLKVQSSPGPFSGAVGRLRGLVEPWGRLRGLVEPWGRPVEPWAARWSPGCPRRPGAPTSTSATLGPRSRCRRPFLRAAEELGGLALGEGDAEAAVRHQEGGEGGGDALDGGVPEDAALGRQLGDGAGPRWPG